MDRAIRATEPYAPPAMPGAEQASNAAASSRPAPPTVEPYRSFPVEALPDPARGFVANAAEAVGCDPALVALPLLSALAAAVGNTRRIQLKRGWTEPAVVWTATVGESGALKSPALDAALAPVRAADRRAGQEHAAAAAKHEKEKLLHERELTRWKKASRSDFSGDPPEPPEPPVGTRYEVADTTVEALAPILRDNWRGVLLARDELAGWLCGFNQYKGGQGGDVAHWLKVWGASDLKVDRKTGQPRTVRVPRAAVSICGTIQPGTLARALGVERLEDGLAARLLLACPPERTPYWTEVEADPRLEQRLADLFERLYELEPARDPQGEPQPVSVPLSRKAKAAFVWWHNEHGEQWAEQNGDLKAVWAKLKGYCARLALVVHCCRERWGDLADPERIDEKSVESGIALADWFKGEARRVYAVLSETDEDRELRQLVEWIERRGGSVTARDLSRGPRKYRGNAEAAESALDALTKAGVLARHTDTHGGGRGRPVSVYRLRSDAGDTGDGDIITPSPAKNGFLSPSPPSPPRDNPNRDELNANESDWGVI